MAWIVPFYAGVLAAALGAYLLALLVRRRRVPWREVGLTILTGLGTLPPVLYNAWIFTTNPAFAAWSAQNRILSPHPAHYLLGFLLLLVPAIWGAIRVLREGEDKWLLPVAWVLAVPLLLYLPFNLQRRMIASAQVPLALLAAEGLVAWFRHKRLALVAYVAVVSLSNLLLVAGSLGPIQQRTAPIYHTSDKVAALEWLAANTQPDEIVLASFQMGNVIPAWTDLRVFAGHGPETLNNAQKQADLSRFFQADTDDEWRQALLQEFGVAYVIFGPVERTLGDWDPFSASYLGQVHQDGEYTIFDVDSLGSRP
jgi:hypothetical protein